MRGSSTPLLQSNQRQGRESSSQSAPEHATQAPIVSNSPHTTSKTGFLSKLPRLLGRSSKSTNFQGPPTLPELKFIREHKGEEVTWKAWPSVTPSPASSPRNSTLNETLNGNTFPQVSTPPSHSSSSLPSPRDSGLNRTPSNMSEGNKIWARRSDSSLPPYTVERPTAVFNPFSGEFERSQMQIAVKELLHRINSLPPLPSDNKLLYEHALLCKTLQGIPEMLDKQQATTANDQLSKGELGLKIRDAYARASEHAQRIANRLEKLKRSEISEKTPLTYQSLAGLLVALKRIHLTGSAPNIAGEYGKKEAQNQDKIAPGINQQAAGSTLTTSTGASAKYGIPHIAGIEVGGTANQLVLTDDDGDINHIPNKTVWAKIEAGVSATTWAPFFQNGRGSSGANVSLQGTVALGDTYFEHEDLSKVVQMDVNRRANQQWMTATASPKIRHLVKKKDKALNLTMQVFGRGYRPTPGAPLYLSDAKMAKGYNSDTGTFLAKKLDELHDLKADTSSDQSWQAWMSKFYPTPAEQLHDVGAQPHKAPIPTTSPIDRAVPASYGYGDGPLTFQRYTAETTNSVSLNSRSVGTGPLLAGFADFSANLRYELLKTNTRNAFYSHEIMDPAFHKDLEKTLTLHRNLDALLINADADEKKSLPAQLYQYHLVKQRLSEDVTPKIKDHPDLNDADTRYFFGESIPAQFHGSIVKPRLSKLKTIQSLCDEQIDLSKSLVEQAGRLMAKPDKFVPQTYQNDLEQQRRAAFEILNEKIWGNHYPEPIEAALRKPEEFLERCHDALGLRLGEIGTHLGILKRQFKQQLSQEKLKLDKKDVRNCFHHADKHYAVARKLMDRHYLPMTKEKLVRNEATFKEINLLERHSFSAKLATVGGVNLNPLKWFTKSIDKSLGPIVLPNEAGHVGLSGEIKYQYTPRHVNPSRVGEFLQITLNAQGGAPLTGKVLEKAVFQGLEKAFPGTQAAELETQASEVARQFKGLVFAVDDGGMVILKFRIAPDVDGSKFFSNRMKLQYIRGLSNRNNNIDVSAPIPLPVGALRVGIKSNDNGQGQLFEVVGRDLSYQMLRHIKQKQVHEAAKQIDNQDGEDISNEALRQAYANSPRDLTAIFGTSDLIIGTLKDAHAALKARDRNDSTGDAPNEFYRYFGLGASESSQHFERIGKVAAEALHFGPGRHVNHKDFEHHEAYAADYVSAENETDAQRLLLTPPPAYGDFNLPFDEDFDWDQLQKDIDRECKNAQERADYFCSDKGRQFLKAHYDLIDTAWHINVGERHHVKPSKAGWVTTIPNADLAQRSKAVLKAQNGATPKTGLKGKLQRFAAPQKTAARSLSLSDLKEKLGSATVSDGHSLPTYDQVVLEKEMQRREKVLNRIG